jgi:hypothetical protein
MKINTILILLLVPLKCFCQKTEVFIFDNENFSYVSISKSSKNVLNYFVIMTDEPNDEGAKCIAGCLSNEYNKVYLLQIPYVMVVKGKQEEFFLEFMLHITDRTKLLESKLYIISDEDYTSLYRETISEDHNFENTYLNDIEAIYKYKNSTYICDLINK